jgi:hypothetical protein
MNESEVKFCRQRNRIRQQQPSSGERKISDGAIDEWGSFEQNRACDAGQVPRPDSPFNTAVFRPGKMIGLELRQMQPSLGFKNVPRLSPGVFRAKGESSAMQRLSLKPFCSGALCHLMQGCHRRIYGQQEIGRASEVDLAPGSMRLCAAVVSRHHIVRQPQPACRLIGAAIGLGMCEGAALTQKSY